MVAIFGGGCFWCLEAVFQKVKGVIKIESGYSGGKRKNPTYEQVITGVTGHAEVIRIEFDENIISFSEIIDIFFDIHDPTQLNRQGNDIGTQYRSVVFYIDDNQKQVVLHKIKLLKKQGINVVTEVVKFENFYKAENYHQNYYNQNPQNPYCYYVITPKIEKFLKKYSDKSV